MGFQHKMVGMLSYFLVERKLIPEFNFITAVDFHLLRVMLANEVLVSTNGDVGRYTERIQKPAREVLAWFIKNNPQYSMVELGDTLWLLYSALCRKSPWNKTVGSKRQEKRRQKGYEAEEEAAQLSLFSEEELKFSFEGWINSSKPLRQSFNTCGMCPVHDSCQFGIPSEHYYQTGQFLLRPKSIQPPCSLRRFYFSKNFIISPKKSSFTSSILFEASIILWL